MAKSIPAQLSMFNPPTLPGSPSAISSPGLGDGVTPCASLAGPMIEPSGPEAAPVSRGATQTYGKVAAKATPIRAIFGLPGFSSSKSRGLQLSLESKLRQRLGAVGSTKCLATWSVLITPAGRSVCQRAVSELIMVGAGYGG